MHCWRLSYLAEHQRWGFFPNMAVSLLSQLPEVEWRLAPPCRLTSTDRAVSSSLPALYWKGGNVVQWNLRSQMGTEVIAKKNAHPFHWRALSSLVGGGLCDPSSVQGGVCEPWTFSFTLLMLYFLLWVIPKLLPSSTAGLCPEVIWAGAAEKFERMKVDVWGTVWRSSNSDVSVIIVNYKFKLKVILSPLILVSFLFCEKTEDESCTFCKLITNVQRVRM